jgi:lysophospholipase L1-like esterase
MQMLSYGHSWIDGDGASSPGSSVAALVSRRLDLELDNRAVGGSSSTATADLIRADPPPQARMYLLMTGLNDLRLGGGSPAFFRSYSAALETILGAFRTTAPGALTLVVAQPQLLDFSRHAPHHHGSNTLVGRYNAELRRIAGRFSGVLVVEANGWDPQSMLDDDTVHPNDSGHACLAEATVRLATTAWQ